MLLSIPYKMKRKKSQSAVEFIILVGIVILFFTIFFVAINENQSDELKQKQTTHVNEIAFTVQEEIDLAFNAQNGYNREFEIPEKIKGQDYNIEITENSIYVQNSRGKFEPSILHALSQIMFDLNKISSDLMMFSMEEFGFFTLPDEICTGSSIMPHKKNPDVLELIRAKYHVINSNEMQVKNINSNLISGYHRDFQLTKKPVIEGFDITKKSLDIISLIFSELVVNKEKCKKAMTEVSDANKVKAIYDKYTGGTPV